MVYIINFFVTNSLKCLKYNYYPFTLNTTKTSNKNLYRIFYIYILQLNLYTNTIPQEHSKDELLDTENTKKSK